MKRLLFNTTTVLWGIVIFLASCAFTTKAQKAQPKTVQQEQKKVPTPKFLEKVKASKKSHRLLGGKTGGEYYDFRGFDFEDYEKLTFDNLFTTYNVLFKLGEHDEMKPLHPIQYMKTLPHVNQKARTTRTYQYLHKGFPVYSDRGHSYEITVYGDSVGKYVWRVPSIILPNLDVDTAVTISSKEAFKTARAAIPLKPDEFFIFEQSVTKIPESERKRPDVLPDINFKIYDKKMSYSFVFGTRGDRFHSIGYKVYEVFVDAQTAEVLYLKEPHNANYLTPPIPEKPEEVVQLQIESEVEYTVENPTISGANNEFLEFDINVASMINNENFYSGEILIDYNALTFGTNLASSGKVTLTKGTVINAPNYTLSIVDVSPDQMKITAQSSPSNPSNYYTITNQSEELAHIKIDISNLAGSTGIEFNEVQMQGLSELFDASLSSNKPFDLVTAADELNIDINGFFNSATCTTCPGGIWTQNSTACSPPPCSCLGLYSLQTESVPTHYYQCRDVSFNECDNSNDNILLSSHRPLEYVQVFYNDNTGPVGITLEWCRTNNEIALSDDELIEANALFSVETSNIYFSTNFGINSFDNAGSRQQVHLFDNSTAANNATYVLSPTERVLNLGKGITGTCGPIVSLDIVAHEYTHGVLSDYIKIGQSTVAGQALQESICDIFSTIIRHDESGGQQTWDGHSIWNIGEEACTNHLSLPRKFGDPLNSVVYHFGSSTDVGQAAYYQDISQNWINISNPAYPDIIKAYNHAGVTSYWFYLLSQGGTGVYGDAVTGIGVDNAEAILVKALDLMLDYSIDNGGGQQDYTFENFRDFTIEAVTDLPAPNGLCSNHHQSVVDAWIAVGLLDCANIDITFEENDPTPANPCDKELTAIVNNGSGCYTFEWFEVVGANLINLGLTTQKIPVTCGKIYRVKVTDTYLGDITTPCEHEDNRAVFATNTRKVEELNLDVTIRPTLANNQIFFDLEVEEPTTITISIFDQLGRRISQPIVSEKVYQGNRVIQHNVENLSSGIYFVSIETPKGKIVKKFVKM